MALMGPAHALTHADRRCSVCIANSHAVAIGAPPAIAPALLIADFLVAGDPIWPSAPPLIERTARAPPLQ